MAVLELMMMWFSLSLPPPVSLLPVPHLLQVVLLWEIPHQDQVEKCSIEEENHSLFLFGWTELEKGANLIGDR